LVEPLAKTGKNLQIPFFQIGPPHPELPWRPGVKVIKLFFFVNDAVAEQARMFGLALLSSFMLI
jgi:hypothetical protein